jgi:hypothetical protein
MERCGSQEALHPVLPLCRRDRRIGAVVEKPL